MTKGPAIGEVWGPIRQHLPPPSVHPSSIWASPGPDLHLGGTVGSAQLSITEGPVLAGIRPHVLLLLCPEAAGKMPGGHSMQDSGHGQAACLASLAPKPWFPLCLKAGRQKQSRCSEMRVSWHLGPGVWPGQFYKTRMSSAEGPHHMWELLSSGPSKRQHRTQMPCALPLASRPGSSWGEGSECRALQPQLLGVHEGVVSKQANTPWVGPGEHSPEGLLAPRKPSISSCEWKTAAAPLPPQFW